jgi:hypothetical protein
MLRLETEDDFERVRKRLGSRDPESLVEFWPSHLQPMAWRCRGSGSPANVIWSSAFSKV